MYLTVVKEVVGQAAASACRIPPQALWGYPPPEGVHHEFIHSIQFHHVLALMLHQVTKGSTTNLRPGGGDAKPKSTRGEGFEGENSLKRQGEEGCSRPSVRHL